MPRIERTPEERKLFYEERSSVLDALTEVQDYDRKTRPDENKKAMMALVDTLDACDNLVNICGNLAGLAVRRGEVKMVWSSDATKRLVTLKDIRVLGSALWTLLKTTEADTPKIEGKPEQTPAIIRIRKAISRVNPVQLFYSAIYGEPFRYHVKQGDKNMIAVSIQRERYFGGIPEDKLPVRVVEVKRDKTDNVTEEIGRVDLGIYPNNAKNIYEILRALEKEQPIVELGAEPGQKTVVSRRVKRAGEAEFFLQRLPKGLKPWAEATS